MSASLAKNYTSAWRRRDSCNIRHSQRGAFALNFNTTRDHGGYRDVFVPSGFFRKPIILTPYIPSGVQILRTMYAVSGATNGTQDGLTLATAFSSFEQVESNAIAGDDWLLEGLFDEPNTVWVGRNGAHGTAAHPILMRTRPGATMATLKLGGGNNGNQTINFGSSGLDSHRWFVNLRIQVQPGTDGSGARFTNANYNKMIGCVLDGAGYLSTNCAHNEMWDCSSVGDYGSQQGNAGDGLAVRDGSTFHRIMRHRFLGNYAHVAMNHQDAFGGAPVTDCEVFDCDVQNPWAGGMHFIHGVTRTHIHWNRVTNIFTNPSQIYQVGSNECSEIASDHNLIEFNMYYGGGGRGLALESLAVFGLPEVCFNNIVRHNVMAFNGTRGMQMASANGVNGTDIANNKFYNNIIWANNRTVFPTPSNDPNYNDSGGYVFGKYFAVYLNLSQCNPGTHWAIGQFYGNEWKNNFFGVDPSVDHADFMVLDRDTNAFSFYTDADLIAGGGGGNNIVGGLPNITSPTNFHLLAASTLIDAGYSPGDVAFLGAKPDIGIFEYGGSD